MDGWERKKKDILFTAFLVPSNQRKEAAFNKNLFTVILGKKRAFLNI